MLANPSKLQAIELNKSNETIHAKFKIKDAIITSGNEVDLLGITIDDKLKFDTHIKNLCHRAGGHCLNRLEKNFTPFCNITI